jgi:hypothetical protein
MTIWGNSYPIHSGESVTSSFNGYSRPGRLERRSAVPGAALVGARHRLVGAGLSLLPSRTRAVPPRTRGWGWRDPVAAGDERAGDPPRPW